MRFVRFGYRIVIKRSLRFAYVFVTITYKSKERKDAATNTFGPEIYCCQSVVISAFSRAAYVLRLFFWLLIMKPSTSRSERPSFSPTCWCFLWSQRCIHGQVGQSGLVIRMAVTNIYLRWHLYSYEISIRILHTYAVKIEIDNLS